MDGDVIHGIGTFKNNKGIQELRSQFMRMVLSSICHIVTMKFTNGFSMETYMSVRGAMER
jgi:hypothetical protein